MTGRLASGGAGHLRAAGSRALVGLVKGYQLCLSPWLGGRCRHVPSCSAYAIEALERFGPVSGGWLALKRLGRCHPWGSWGYDPVPERPGGGDAVGDGDAKPGGRPA